MGQWGLKCICPLFWNFTCSTVGFGLPRAGNQQISSIADDDDDD